MSTSIGQDEPHRSPKKAYFSCAIGVYFMSFFYEHPVFYCAVLDYINPNYAPTIKRFGVNS